jgi:tetratricopeptide (TPR) repeat protein
MLNRLSSLLKGRFGASALVMPGTAERAIAEGLAALDSGHLQDALRTFERAVMHATREPTLLQRCGSALAERGHLNEAAAYFRRVLQIQPGDPSASTDLANVMRARGDTETARALYERALASDPDFVPALLNLGLTCLAAGAFKDALTNLDRVIRCDPSNGTALRYAGDAAYAKGEFGAAEGYYARALGKSDAPENSYGLARALIAQDMSNQAMAVLERNAGRHPEHLETLNLLGTLALGNGSIETAVHWLERAADAAPDNAALQSNFGLALVHAGRLEEAIDILHLARHHDPKFAPAHLNLGIAYTEAKRWSDAADALRDAATLAPDDPAAAMALGRALQELDRLEEAAAALERATKIAPGAEAWTALGQVYRELGEFGCARAAFEKALEADPDYLDALIYLGLIAIDELAPHCAIECFDRVLAGGPNDLALWNITCTRLLCGDWERAWEFHELRWKSPQAVQRPFSFPTWDGGDLSGKTLLVYAEQGLGDEIMFASCYRELLDRVKHLVIECSPKLEKLFRRSFPEASVFGREKRATVDWLDSAPKIDLQAACGTVASVLRRSAESFPQEPGYLSADPGRVAYWQDRLAALGPGLKIGISWRGGSARTRARFRSIPLSDWQPLFALPNVSFISLQYHADVGAELDAFATKHGVRIHHWQEAINDYDETAALATAVASIVTVCTAIVHLGGALGRPVRVVVPASPEWRYGINGETMIWYPTVRLFRQAQPGKWRSVIDCVRNALAADIVRLPNAVER